jgi:Na+-translocating ferredoxin:NAD+ oxidoreductase subunit B
MSPDIYEKLRDQMDQYSVGYPSTASGVEMEILRRLFTEEEAGMYLNMTMLLEPPQSVAERIGRETGEIAEILERMAEKGLLFRLVKGDSRQYAAAPYIVGIFEFQLKTMDRGLALLMEQYFEEAFAKEMSRQVVPMRTVPVNRSLGVSWPVAPYEDLREIVKSKDRIAVANCICRVQKGLLEDSCDKPIEVCLSFGSHAEYYVGRGMGRWITQEEALRILDLSEEEGLVPQPFNAQNPGGLCNCCGDCCGILRSLKKHPKPATMVVSNYYAAVDPDLCTACEICMERCQMDAVSIGHDDIAVIDRDRCIGCGLCVTTCPVEAMGLKPKTLEERRDPPKAAQETMMRLAQERGKSLVPLAFVKGTQN